MEVAQLLSTSVPGQHDPRPVTQGNYPRTQTNVSAWHQMDFTAKLSAYGGPGKPGLLSIGLLFYTRSCILPTQ